MGVDLAKLGRFITDHFAPEQLGTLCQELNVPYASLLGDTHPARAFDLVTVMRDQGQLSALLAAVAQARPDTFDPRLVEVGHQPQRSGRRALGLPVLLGGGALLIAFFSLFIRQPASTTPAPSVTVAGTVTATPAAATPTASHTALAPTMPVSSPTAPPEPGVTSTDTPSPSVTPPPTITPLPSSTPFPSASSTMTLTPSPSASSTMTLTPSPTASSTMTLTPSPTLPPTATPVLSASSPALAYDPTTRALRLSPGDASLERGRLCTPLHTYQNSTTVYLTETTAELLGLPLPSQARVSHSYPELLGDEPVARILDVQRHPIEGVKFTGEKVSFIGCDLLVDETLRQSLGLSTDLGEFDDAARFNHGWVNIEFLAQPGP
jgi:hypothetical protein